MDFESLKFLDLNKILQMDKIIQKMFRITNKEVCEKKSIFNFCKKKVMGF